MYKTKLNDSLLSPVNKFFRIQIPPLGCTFNLSIPRHFVTSSRHHYVGQSNNAEKRVFYFSELELSPSYFNVTEDEIQKKAGEKKEETEMEVEFQVVYNIDPESTRKDFDCLMQPSHTHSDLVKSINAFFDDRDQGIKQTQFYVDWIVDGKSLIGFSSFEEFLNAHMDKLYDPSKVRYDTALIGHSMVSDYGLNKYLFPTHEDVSSDPEILKDFRFRLFVAPKAKVIFSNRQFLSHLGFTDEQLLRQFYFNEREEKFAIQNFSGDFSVLTADAPPATLAVGEIITTRIRVGFVENNMYSRVVTFVMPMSVFTGNSAELASKIKEELAELSFENNIPVDLDYAASAPHFSFRFPASTYITCYFSCEEFLAHRLGYGYTKRISKTSELVPVRTTGSANAKEDLTVTERSEILCVDTGSVVVILENVASNKTAEIDSTVMASLRPTGHGTMSKTHRDFHDYLVDLSSQCVTSDEEVVLRFRIVRKNDRNIFENLNWSTGCFISGCLEGVDAKLLIS